MYHNHNNSLIFGTKIQIHNFGHFSKNSIFGQNLRFSNSVILHILIRLGVEFPCVCQLTFTQYRTLFSGYNTL